MLSILIPTYNYSAYPLVEELYNQCVEAKIVFEIIVLDDGSTDFLLENNDINGFENCRLEKNKINLGRSKTCSFLVQYSKYDCLLLMDCDTFPKDNLFISNYLKMISDDYEIYFGGIAYKRQRPENNKILRWKYGINREEINICKRIKKPYSTTLTSNILFKKQIFDKVKFNEQIVSYGYEDLVFVQNLKSLNYKISHIENSTFHLNYETSEVFLNKTKQALKTLYFIEKNKILIISETKIQKYFGLIKKLKLNSIVNFLFKKFNAKAEKNLTSKNPSLFVFDLYKLGYFCSLKSK
ncbi:glycosyltransferase [Flavobacterium sp.]|uniref:glycosyltransferase family 2 protein n=1 Tax=Flavobacterium sp. TaxID=239 RepID=UPI00286CA575|nr:glycosyltransferase [Flavobacterium sp.]